jgi:hypothetical protein
MPDQFLKIFGLQNVKYFVSFNDLVGGDNLKLVKSVNNGFLPPVKIYQNQKFLPYAFGVFENKIVKPTITDEDFLNLLFDPNFDPQKQVILYDNNKVKPIENATGTAVVRIEEKNDGYLSVSADFSKDGYLVLSQPAYPGWQVWVDGKQDKVLPANYAFSAIGLTAGQHQVILKFQPLDYQLGKKISLGSLIILALYLIGYLFYSRKNKAIKL